MERPPRDAVFCEVVRAGCTHIGPTCLAIRNNRIIGSGHAEDHTQSPIVDLTTQVEDLMGATVYYSQVLEFAEIHLLIKLQISEIVFVNSNQWPLGQELLENAGITVRYLDYKGE